MIIRAKKYDYVEILKSKGSTSEPCPLIRDDNGDETMENISPTHGRSYVVGKNKEGRYIICKGGGLSYTAYSYLNTKEFGDDSLGLLLKTDALRDFHVGNEIGELGIKTNKMEYVLEITNYPIVIPISKDKVNPIILQYTVECPFRIEDAVFMSRENIQQEVEKWQEYNRKGYVQNYKIAADVLIRNLRILHDNKILHNALTTHNFTWALELLDFELAHSPKYPYTSEDDRRHVMDFFAREIIDVYRIINYIAGVLREDIEYSEIDRLFLDYGFDLKEFKL